VVSYDIKAVKNVIENEYHFSLEVVDQDLSSLEIFTKHLMVSKGKGLLGPNGGRGKEESIRGIGGGSFVKRSIVAKDGLGGYRFVVEGGRSPSTSSKDGEDSGVANKSSMGSRDSGGEIIGEVGGATNAVFGLLKQHGLTLILTVHFRLVLFSLGIMEKRYDKRDS
ncbi:hypothetical protein Tco_1545571, partial [Tanacetum coccineum]